MKLHIRRFAETLEVDVETGRVVRKPNVGEVYVASEQWIVTGAALMNRSGRVTAQLSRFDFARLLSERPHELFYKSGKPKFAITDLDHGTFRMWMNPEVLRGMISVTHEVPSELSHNSNARLG